MILKKHKLNKLFVFVLTVLFLVACMCNIIYAQEEHRLLPETFPTGTEISGGAEDPGTSGLQFTVKENGYITKICLYVVSGRSQTQSVTFWNNENDTIIAGPYTWTLDLNTTGWQEFTLPEAIEVAADIKYAAVVSNNGKFMSAIHGWFDNNSPLSDMFVWYQRGWSWDKDTLPNNWNGGGTYLVDVIFVTEKPEEATPEVTSSPTPEVTPETTHEVTPAQTPEVTPPEQTDSPDTGDISFVTFASAFILLLCLGFIIVRKMYIKKATRKE